MGAGDAGYRAGYGNLGGPDTRVNPWPVGWCECQRLREVSRSKWRFVLLFLPAMECVRGGATG